MDVANLAYTKAVLAVAVGQQKARVRHLPSEFWEEGDVLLAFHLAGLCHACPACNPLNEPAAPQSGVLA